MDVRLPDGTVIQNVPEGTTKAQLVQKLKANGMSVPAEWMPAPAPAPSFGEMFRQEVMGSVPVQAALGAIRGAGSIGSTLMAPVDAAARVMGIQNSFVGRDDRREAMTGALQQMGADPESLAFQAGKIGGEVAGTAGAGGVLGNIAGRAGAAAPIVQALRTGGLSGASMPARMAAGVATGATAAGMVNPQEATTGAAIGAAVPLVGPALNAGGTLVRKALGGTTGVGDEAISQAFQAGRQGGATAQQFTSNMRGQAPMDDVLTMAKQNLQAMGQQRQQAYRSGMANIKADKSVLSFDGIDDAVSRAREVSMFKGRPINDKTAQAVQQVSEEVSQWKQLDPTEFHTPEGLDALKQRIGGILESLDPQKEGAARKAVGDIYNSIKSEVSKQAPEYSKVMRDYSEATDLIREIERTLSLGQKASADTAMRKLQSLMRNNVNTSYGFRDQIAQQLQQTGGQNFMPALAGQALSDVLPRGMQRTVAGSGGAGLLYFGEPVSAAALAATSSPRLIGEASYLAGRGAGMVNPALIEALRRGSVATAPVIGAQ